MIRYDTRSGRTYMGDKLASQCGALSDLKDRMRPGLLVGGEQAANGLGACSPIRAAHNRGLRQERFM